MTNSVRKSFQPEHLKQTTSLLILAAICAVAPIAEAQQKRLDTVVISARKKAENLQETPIAITAFSAADLEQRNIGTLDGIGDFTPNLVFDQGTGNTGSSSTSQVYIRGIGQADFLFTTEPGVGIYVDGVYLPRSIGSIMDLVNIERIEVLKGPQGTLFGKNSVGGAINIVSRKPGQEAAGQASMTMGSDNRLELRGYVDIPLIKDKLAASIAISSKDQDGYVERPLVQDELGGVDSKGIRGELLWTPAESLDVSVTADYVRRRDDAVANTLIDVDQSGGLLALWNGLVAPYLGVSYDNSYIADDPFVSFGTGPNYSDLDLWGVSASATWRLGDQTVKSITAYRDQEAAFALDTDHSPLTFFEQAVIDKQEQFSQELQLLGNSFKDRLDYVLGALYFHEEGLSQYRIQFAPGLYDALEFLPAGIIPGLGGAGNPIHPELDYNALLLSGIDNDSYSVFAHGNLKLTDKLSASGGLRYTLDEKTFDTSLARLSAGILSHDVTISDEWNAWTPKFGLDYKWTDRFMTYASVAKGFKSGGFNGRAANSYVATQPYAPEYVWTYEAGFKSEFADRRLILNGAAFFSDYTNLQLLVIDTDQNGGIVARVENAGAAEISGFELELNAIPVENVRIDAGLGYLDGEYTELDPSVQSITLDSTLVKSPKWSINLGGEVYIPLPASFGLTARADYSYRSRTEHVADNNPMLTQDAYDLLNLRLSFGPESGVWEVAAFGKNVTDERYITNGLSQTDTLGTTDVTYGRPSEWGVSAKWSF